MHLPNIWFRLNIRWFLDAEGLFSAETKKSGIGDSLDQTAENGNLIQFYYVWS